MSKLILGDSLLKLKELPNNSIDAVVTDPPYGLSFMGKKWDYDVPSTEIWREVLRVLKPGGHLLSFGGTRTYHRLAVNIEDAGFEIRDQIQWLYGSGFPKSTDVSKRIDKEAGAERTKKMVPTKKGNYPEQAGEIALGATGMRDISTPITPIAKQWQGWGTALKPANEPIVVARKPLEKGLTVAENVQKWGTGAINIDGTRIGTEMIQGGRAGRSGESSFNVSLGEKPPMHQGRWPANIILDEAAAEMLDAQSGVSKSGKAGLRTSDGFNANSYGKNMGIKAGQANGEYGDSGGASRFFYVAKASKRERGNGNVHPTVKPIKLMQYLITLVTPPNGTVLDPFMGSGSTGVAAKELGFGFIGIELSEEYFNIATKRVSA